MRMGKLKIKNRLNVGLLDRYAFEKDYLETYRWSKPYNDPNIESGNTGLDGKFKYSPVFVDSIVDTMVELTGYRKKDYIIAEEQTGKKHMAGRTVWHHAWNEKDGKYLMQLVDFEEHKKTCPHAGGCKLWLLNKGYKLQYAIHKKYNRKNTGNYSDKSHFYRINESEIGFYQKGYVSRKTLSIVRRKKIALYGTDVYGNLLYGNAKKLFFWDHENDVLTRIR